MTRLAIVVIKTVLETSSASLLYFMAMIDVMAAAGIAESRMTTDLSIPVRLNRFTARSPNSKPTPTLRKDASNGVGRDVIFTRERLDPSKSKTSGIVIIPIKFNGLIIKSGTAILERLMTRPAKAGYTGGTLNTSLMLSLQCFRDATYIPNVYKLIIIGI